MTRWARDVSPANAHPEYPRPQMVRERWQNLNGLWDYAVVARDAAQPTAWDGKILVPYPIESALSGVRKRVSKDQHLWYHRTFTVPAAWKGQRVLLHFGAVDWEATAFVNGKQVGSHKGGYGAFSFDITDALKPGDNALVLRVFDPTSDGAQARGKQVNKPGGIWYTPTTGIWQTVWLEPVNAAHIESFHLVPDIDAGTLTVSLNAQAQPGKTEIAVAVLDGGKPVTEGSITLDGATKPGLTAPRITIAVKNPKLWTPDSPFLYDLKLTLKSNGKVVDEITSYVGMRKTSIGKDENGVTRLLLNNKFLFQIGFLDQGFWPDGLYTAPTDEALRY
ncbi:hypothetical protein HQ576_15460, partial [bacterium]|nr:hypothetical protein [bacterium]